MWRCAGRWNNDERWQSSTPEAISGLAALGREALTWCGQCNHVHMTRTPSHAYAEVGTSSHPHSLRRALSWSSSIYIHHFSLYATPLINGLAHEQNEHLNCPIQDRSFKKSLRLAIPLETKRTPQKQRDGISGNVLK